MSEADVQSQVVALLKAAGAFPEPYHTHDSRRSPAGFPDLVAVVEGTLWCIEVKAEHGKLSPEQVDWADALVGLGRPVRFWLAAPHNLDRLRAALGLPALPASATETGGKAGEGTKSHSGTSAGHTEAQALRIDPDDPREKLVHETMHVLGVSRARAEAIVAYNERGG